MAKKHGNSIKDSEMYEALREDGASKEKAARISNAAAKEGRSTVGKRGGKGGDLEERTKDELYDEAKKLGIDGRSKMSKKELVSAIRHH